MRATRSWPSVVVSGLVMMLYCAPRLAAQEREPTSLLLIDPAWMPEAGNALARSDSLRRNLILATAAGRKFQYFLIPSQGFSSSSTTGVQLRTQSVPDLINVGGTFPIALNGSVSYARIDQHTVKRNRGQASVALNHKFGTAEAPKASITVTGLYSNTENVARDLKGAAQLEIPVAPFVFGAVSYYDQLTPAGGSAKTGFTGGFVGGWTPRAETQFGVEYDFKSDISGEDAFTAKLSQSIGTWNSHGVTFTVAGGKHRVISTSLRITL